LGESCEEVVERDSLEFDPKVASSSNRFSTYVRVKSVIDLDLGHTIRTSIWNGCGTAACNQDDQQIEKDLHCCRSVPFLFGCAKVFPQPPNPYSLVQLVVLKPRAPCTWISRVVHQGWSFLRARHAWPKRAISSSFLDRSCKHGRPR
jgi:hypothetical protein